MVASVRRALLVARRPHQRRSTGTRGPHIVSRNDITSLSRIQFLKKVFSSTYPTPVAEALIKAHRSSTSAQYEHCWRNFQSWLSSASNSPIAKGTILEYLVHLADSRGLNPKTVLVYRNALHLPLLHGFKINTKDQEFSLVARSQFITNPPRQKLIPHWKPNRVLSMLEQPRFVTSKASPINLMMKTLFLVALATGNRVSELAAMSRGSISFGADRSRVTIPVKPGFLYKNQSVARAPPNITFPCLYNDDGSHHRLCPVSALHRSLQIPDPWGHDAVFINPQSKKPMNSGAINPITLKVTYIRTCRNTSLSTLPEWD